MKRVFLFLIAITGFITHAQDLQLELRESSKLPNSKSEHTYKFAITNNFTSTKTVQLIAVNTNCESMDRNRQTDLAQTIIDPRSNTTIETLNLRSGATESFHLVLNRLNNTPLGRTNCTKVYAEINNVATSNAIIIKRDIPDPQSFN